MSLQDRDLEMRLRAALNVLNGKPTTYGLTVKQGQFPWEHVGHFMLKMEGGEGERGFGLGDLDSFQFVDSHWEKP